MNTLRKSLAYVSGVLSTVCGFTVPNIPYKVRKTIRNTYVSDLKFRFPTISWHFTWSQRLMMCFEIIQQWQLRANLLNLFH